MLDESASPVDQLLHHRFDAPALGAVAYRRVAAQQATLSHQAQDVHRQRSKLADEVVGVELTQWLLLPVILRTLLTRRVFQIVPAGTRLLMLEPVSTAVNPFNGGHGKLLNTVIIYSI